ncbi:MAG: pilus assembly FimT family protein, partial [Pseudomonadota bacterium]
MAIPARQPSRHHGFTLIEAMITLAVLVILITLAAPAFNLAEQRRVIG